MRRFFVLPGLAFAAFTVQQAAAEPQLDQPVRLAIKRQFVAHLGSESCAQFFRFYSMGFENWVLQPTVSKAHVVFYVEFIADKALYGMTARAKFCLGREAGEGFFEKGKVYRSADFIYSLSKWDLGWHVDRIEYAAAGSDVASGPTVVEHARPPLANPQDLYNSGYTHFLRGEYDEAIADYTAAIAADPSMALAYNNRCLVRVIARRDIAAAQADCREAVARLPNDIQVRETQGFVRLLVNDPRNALDEYNAALAIDPKRPRALFGRGLAKEKLGDSKGAKADKTTARKLDSGVERDFGLYGII